jgi:hypothetical protein
LGYAWFIDNDKKMKFHIQKFTKGAASSGTLTIVGVCIAVVAIAVPMIAVSFSAMALWKSPETVPSISGSSLSYDSDGTPTGTGGLIKDCPAVKAMGATNLANYNKWIGYINAGVAGTSAPASLVAAILSAGEHDGNFPDTASDCKAGANCIKGWAVSTSYAYGPFQFINSTWWTYGMTPDERTALLNANGNIGHINWWNYPLTNAEKKAIEKAHPGVTVNDKKIPVSDTVFDNARAAKGTATYLGANMDNDSGPTYQDKIKAAITRYNPRLPAYLPRVYAAYEVLSTCLESPGGVGGDVPPAGLSKPELVLWWARHELTLNPSLKVPPPIGFHTANGENKVKYRNIDVNDVKSVIGDSQGWCIAFVTWVYEKAGYDIRPTITAGFGTAKGKSGEAIAESLDKGLFAGHEFISQASLSSVNPKNLKNSILPGDIIVMRSVASGSGFHAGIVEKVDDSGGISTIEGNVTGRIADVESTDFIARRPSRDRPPSTFNLPYTINQEISPGIKRIIGFGRW